jgi:hypothetical protein
MSNTLVRPPSRCLPKRHEHIADATMTILNAAWHVAVERVILPPFRDLKDGFKIRRALPSAQRRMVGSFIFLNHFEPIMFRARASPNVGSHPHVGLSAVTRLPEAAMPPRKRGQYRDNPCRWRELDDGRPRYCFFRVPPAKVQAQGGSMLRWGAMAGRRRALPQGSAHPLEFPIELEGPHRAGQ